LGAIGAVVVVAFLGEDDVEPCLGVVEASEVLTAPEDRRGIDWGDVLEDPVPGLLPRGPFVDRVLPDAAEEAIAGFEVRRELVIVAIIVICWPEAVDEVDAWPSTVTHVSLLLMRRARILGAASERADGEDGLAEDDAGPGHPVTRPREALEVLRIRDLVVAED
jgi:hypothetical protein